MYYIVTYILNILINIMSCHFKKVRFIYILYSFKIFIRLLCPEVFRVNLELFTIPLTLFLLFHLFTLLAALFCRNLWANDVAVKKPSGRHRY